MSEPVMIVVALLSFGAGATFGMLLMQGEVDKWRERCHRIFLKQSGLKRTPYNPSWADDE